MTQTSVATTVASTAVVLTGAERRKIGGLAERLARTGPAETDDLDWIRAVRDASAELPQRLLAGLRSFRHDAGPDGVLLVRNLPVHPADGAPLPPLPRTPAPWNAPRPRRPRSSRRRCSSWAR